MTQTSERKCFLDFNASHEHNDFHTVYTLAGIIAKDDSVCYDTSMFAIRLLMRREKIKKIQLGSKYKPSWFVDHFITDKDNDKEFPSIEHCFNTKDIGSRNFYNLLRPGWWYKENTEQVYFFPGYQQQSVAELIAMFNVSDEFPNYNSPNISIVGRSTSNNIPTATVKIDVGSLLRDYVYVGKDTEVVNGLDYLTNFIKNFAARYPSADLNYTELMKTLVSLDDNDGRRIASTANRIYTSEVFNSIDQFLLRQNGKDQE